MTPKRDKRRKIMEAAERLFQSRRFHEITLDEVARAAKVGKGTIYLHFKDKDDLFFQTATSGYDRLREILIGKIPRKASFRKQLESICVEYRAFIENRRPLHRMMHTEEARMYWHRGEIRDLWREKNRRLIAAVAEILSRGTAEGEIRRDIPAEALATFFLGLVRSGARAAHGSPVSRQPCGKIVDLFCGGAAASGRKRRQP